MWLRANGKKIDMGKVYAMPWYVVERGKDKEGYVLTAKYRDTEEQYLIGVYDNMSDLDHDYGFILQAMEYHVVALVLGTKPVLGMEIKTDTKGRLLSIWGNGKAQYIF